MNRLLHIAILALIFITTCFDSGLARNPAAAPDPDSPDFVSAKLLIASDGEAIYQSSGHAMLLMECPSAGLRYIFSFESEDLEGDFSRLFYQTYGRVVAIPPEEYLQQFRDEGRSVTAFTLNLTPREKRELWRVLDEYVVAGGEVFNIRSRSCTSILLEAINAAVAPDEITVDKASLIGGPDAMIIDTFVTDNARWRKLILIMALGCEADKYVGLFTQSAPIVIAHEWKYYQLSAPDGTVRPLFKGKPEVIIPATGNHESRTVPPLTVAIIAIAVCAMITALQLFGKGRKLASCFDILLTVFITAVGILLLFIECIPARIGTLCNPNFILFSPVPLICWLIFRKKKFFPGLCAAYCILLILYCVAGPWLSLCIPLPAALFALVPAIRIAAWLYMTRRK